MTRVTIGIRHLEVVVNIKQTLAVISGQMDAWFPMPSRPARPGGEVKAWKQKWWKFVKSRTQSHGFV